MRIFNNCAEAISEITRDLFSRGQVVFDPTVQGITVDRAEWEMKELMGYTYVIVDTDDKESMIEWSTEHFPTSDQTIRWAEAWHKDRVSGIPYNPPPSYKMRREFWEKYLDTNGRFSYTYCKRMENLEMLINSLRENRYRRGAYQTIFESTADFYNTKEGKRVPCSLGYHFLVRPTPDGDRMNLLYFMRSCDLVNHFASDVYMAVRLLEHVASQIGVQVGRFQHVISSLHAYIKDVPDDRRW